MKENYEKIQTFGQSFETGESFLDDVKYRGYLERIVSTDKSGKLRTKHTYGNFIEPQVGRGFAILSLPLELDDPNANRLIHTSNVSEIEKVSDDEIVFRTRNGSRYRVAIHEHI